MPQPPYVWQPNDFVTASQLQTEMRSVGTVGPFPYNGAGWHTNKPVYRQFIDKAPAATTGTQQSIATTSTSSSTSTMTVLTNGQLFRSGAINEAAHGRIVDRSNVTAGGGEPGVGGGYFFNIAQMFFDTTGSSTSNLAQVGIGWFGNGETAAHSVGTIQDASSAAAGCWAAAIMDAHAASGSQETTVWYNNGSAGHPAPAGLQANDGSGATTRLQGFWVSTYTANGVNVSALPTIQQTYTSSSTVSSALLNSQIQQTMTLLNTPPCFQAYGRPTPVAAHVWTPVNYGNSSALDVDSYQAFNQSSGVYTVPLSGLYLVTAFAGVDGGTVSTGSHIANGVRVNGTVYPGPGQSSVSTNSWVRSGKAQIFSLNAGDTIQHVVYSNVAYTLCSSQRPQFGAVWLGYNTAPSTLPTLPDTTSHFMAGADPVATFNQIGNDLTFLTQKPYALAYSTNSQVVATGGNGSLLRYNNYVGQVHGDAANGWSAMNTNGQFTAPVDGFYLLCAEVGFALTGTISNPWSQVGFQVTPGGTVTSDWFGQGALLPFATSLGGFGGQNALGIYYLHAGDTASVRAAVSATSGVATTAPATAGVTHFEAVWLSS